MTIMSTLFDYRYYSKARVSVHKTLDEQCCDFGQHEQGAVITSGVVRKYCRYNMFL
jgi:hypothetical protein